MIVKQFTVAIVLLALMLSSACSGMYYDTMENLGIHKRDILVDRVQDARDAQQESKDQFKSALARFNHELNIAGDDLENKYDLLNDEYEKSRDDAAEVSDRIEKIESVAKALFNEWQEEVGEYANATLRQSSQRQLEETKAHYNRLIRSMKRAEAKMAPVLAAFRDQVLFIKHNLNARAIASLQGELINIEGEVARLIKDMEASIREADAFINSMSSTSRLRIQEITSSA